MLEETYEEVWVVWRQKVGQYLTQQSRALLAGMGEVLVCSINTLCSGELMKQM